MRLATNVVLALVIASLSATARARLTGFNILNHTNFDQVDTIVSSSTFGQVLSTHEPRIIQLGLKFGF